MYLVYLLPVFLIVVIALAIFAGPVLAAIVFVAFLIGLAALKFAGRTEPEHVSPGESAAVGTSERSGREEAEGGVWGESWPEQRQGGEPS